VSAFIQDDEGRILMIRRTDNDLYAIPGGQLELGETLAEAAVREVHEETGIECEVKGVVGLYSDPSTSCLTTTVKFDKSSRSASRATPKTHEVKTSSESSEVLWIPPGNIPSLTIHDSILLRIRHALSGSDNAFFT
jgi:ADP-ribose pyrophosphatase YjhB (NUDIX family)